MLLIYIILTTIAFFAAFNTREVCQSKKIPLCVKNANVATMFLGAALFVQAIFGAYTLVSRG